MFWESLSRKIFIGLKSHLKKRRKLVTKPEYQRIPKWIENSIQIHHRCFPVDIVKVWKTSTNGCFGNLMKMFCDQKTVSLEKRISCALALTQLSLDWKIKKLKSDCRFYKWASVTFQKWGYNKRKLVHEAGHVSWAKGSLLEINCSIWICKGASNKLLWFSWSIYMVVD